jgi:hypothetical protein
VLRPFANQYSFFIVPANGFFLQFDLLSYR